MSNSVTNAKLLNGVQNQGGGQTARTDLNTTASVTVSAGQGREIFSQVNVNLGANLRASDVLSRKDKPANGNDSESEKTDWKSIKQGTDSAETVKEQGTESSKTPETSRRSSAKPNGSDNRESNEPIQNRSAEKLNKGQNASPNESNRGHDKSEQSNPNSIKTLPNNLVKTAVNALKNAVENTPLLNNKNQPTNNDAPGRNASHSTAPPSRVLNLTINFSVSNDAENNPNSQNHSPDGILSEVISQVFRESDVYLSKNAVDALVKLNGATVSTRSINEAFETLPKEIFQLVETIENQVLQTSDRVQIDDKYNSNRITIELPPELDNQIQAARNLLTQIFGVSDAKHFAQLNIREKMLAAIEIFLKNLPAGMPGDLQNKSAEKILAGFLLARGLVCADSRNQTENLLGMMQSAASDKVSLASMRDFGGLVKALISDAATAKSTANLENAVQKFARILAAINCLDTILTAVKLANQSQFANGNVGRTLAIVQVYELINRLVLAGQNAMQEAAEIAQKNAQFKGEDKNSRSVFPAKTVADLTETETANQKNGDLKNVQAESALRKFLEFNPMLAADKFVSAFESSDDARQAQNDFLDRHQIEIEQWLRGGNHRLVKDIEFEKPIGIVVERGKNDFFSATAARIVLVRDGSVQGWHFLKSFLVA